MFIIKYQPLEVDPTFADASSVVYRPMLPVAVYGIKGRVEIQALVDTGAAETIIPLGFWDEIEPAFRPGENGSFRAANGTEIEVKYGTVDLEIRPGNKAFRWHAKVGFSDEREEMILGDVGFLRYFAATFNGANRSFQVWRSGNLPQSLLTMIKSEPLYRPFRLASDQNIPAHPKRPRR